MATLPIATHSKNATHPGKAAWQATLSAPLDYPIDIISGELVSTDARQAFDPIWGTINTGWGHGSGFLGHPTQKSTAPASMTLTWYSHVEKKFFTGSWNLDTRRLSHYFNTDYSVRNPYTQRIHKETYHRFTIGMAPKGHVQLWIGGDNEQKEAGTYQAHEIQVRPNALAEDAKYLANPEFLRLVYRDDLDNNAKTQRYLQLYGKTTPERLQAWSTPRTWKIVIESTDQQTIHQPAVDILHLINGERIANLSHPILNYKTDHLAPPELLLISWSDPQGRRKRIKMHFDAQKIQQAMRTLSAGNTDIILRVTLSDQQSNAQIMLQAAQEKIDPTLLKLEFGYL
ncbi:DUF2931 family protein [Alcaligenes sp. SDU_A2]|uniref:DUF2931 family protein n=1 Tax=Alcaligenes sp. SDU_A2 TaxID=3136634 RepID=UPI00311ED846